MRPLASRCCSYFASAPSIVARPVKELKGFSKRLIQSGHVEHVELALTAKELGYIDGRGSFFLDPGEFDIFVGGSSNTRLHTLIDLTSDQVQSLLRAKGT